MTNMQIPHAAWVLVGDGRRALVLRNEGDERFPNLRALAVFKEEVTPSTAELGTDAPGRAVEHLTGRRSGMEQTDWHDIAEHRFAQSVASTLCARDNAGDITALVVVAPPRTLAELRSSFTDSLKAKVIAEVNKDLTRHPVYEIERLLTGAKKA
jgi:protein required for attachment to host cells